MNQSSITRRNFIFMTAEGALIFLGLTFLDSNTVVPVFVYTYAGSLQLVGLVNTIRAVAMLLPAVLIGPYVPAIRNVPRFIALLTLTFRPLFLLMVPVVLAGVNPRLVVWTFFGIFAAFFISEGLIGVPWWEVFSRTIPPGSRGKLLGLQQFLSGIGNIAGGFLIKAILESERLSVPAKYAIIFAIAGTLTTASALAMLMVRDFPGERFSGSVNIKEYFGRMPGYFIKNREYVKLTAVQIVSVFTGVMVPFVTLFNKTVFDLLDRQISTLIFIQILGALFGGILWGGVSNRMGNKHVILISQAAGLLLNLLGFAGLFLGIRPAGYAMAFLGGIYSGSWLGFMNYILDVTGEKERHIYLVINNITNFPFSFVSYLAGVAATKLGFGWVLAAGLSSACLGVGISLFLKSPKELYASDSQ